MVGAAGFVAGVTAEDAMEYAPIPTGLAAAIRKTYAVPFVRLVIMAAVTVEAPSLTVVQVVPPLLLNWTT